MNFYHKERYEMHALGNQAIKNMLDELALKDDKIAAAIGCVGYPSERINPGGFAVLLRVIVGQQLSVKAAATIYLRFADLLDDNITPERVLALDADTMRGVGMSRQKFSYSHSLAQSVQSGLLDFDSLDVLSDEEVITVITAVKGLGRWSAEMYLMFSMGRVDIWPIDDLAVRAGIARILGENEKPTPKMVGSWGEAWRPYRSAVALLSWHYYSNAPL